MAKLFAHIEPGDNVVRYSRVYQRGVKPEPSRYSGVSEADIQKIVAAISSFDWAVWARDEMEKQRAKAPPTVPAAEEPLAAKPGDRVATKTVLEAPASPFAGTVYFGMPEALPPAIAEPGTTPTAVAQRAASQPRGRYKRYDALQAEIVAEAAGQQRYSQGKADTPEGRAAAIAAVAEQNARAGKYQRYDEIAHGLGL